MANNALVIGLNYKGSPNSLPDCDLDANAIDVLAYEAKYKIQKELGIFSVGDIVDAIRRIARDSKSTSKTIISFSGHGTQWSVDKPTPSEPDGYDEGICMWNGKHIEVFTDDDFREEVTKIKGVVFLLMDSCFSGGMQKLAFRQHELLGYQHVSRLVKYSPDWPIIRTGDGSAQRSLVTSKLYFMMASSEWQEAISTGTGGLFTKGFCEAYKSTVPSKRTVSRMMSEAAKYCAGNQTPKLIIENGSASKRVF